MPDSKTLSVKPIVLDLCTGIKEGWFERFKLGGDRSELDAKGHHVVHDGMSVLCRCVHKSILECVPII